METEHTIRMRLRTGLLERADALAERMGLTRETYLERALAAQVQRDELMRLKEDIAVLEIDRRILAEGEALDIPPLAEEQAVRGPTATCQLCLTEFPAPARSVDGPLLCDDCLALAKGGDFSAFESG